MMIKYEPVFGDQSLFNNAPEDAVFAIKGTKVKTTFYTEDEPVHFCFNNPYKGFIDMAMRHVIKTPTWTRADQEAGVLPPVGALFQTSVGSRKCVITEGGFIFTVHEGHVEVFNIESAFPIETPEEKAKHLEDEFVLSLLSKDRRGALSMVHAGYTHGIIDAYRKIKAEGLKND